MIKFQDLSLEHKTQLVLNFRMQALLTKFVAETQQMSIEEVCQLFYEGAAKDVFVLTEAEINNHLAQLDKGLEEHVKNESRGIVRVDLEG